VALVLASAASYPSLAKARPLKDGVMSMNAGGISRAFADGEDEVTRDEKTYNPLMAIPADLQMSPAAFWRLQAELFSLIEANRDPTTSYRNHLGHVVPSLAGAPAPSPLMLWWALLLGLSSLARYHPAEWVAALDLNSSMLAYRLEQVLDVAMERVPTRVWDGLAG
jgi:hypothetical protein